MIIRTVSRSVLLMLAVAVAAAPAVPQSRQQRPALIRDTDKAEGKDEVEESKEKVYNPLEAERNLRVGDFYFKRKNYVAAIQRYLEALQYQPNMIKAFDGLGKAYEKSGDISKALEVYRDFIQKYPASPKVSDFQSRIERLEKKSG